MQVNNVLTNLTRNVYRALPVLLLAAAAQAQVLAPQEISDPQIRALQQKYLGELKLIAQAANQQRFRYHFYFSRTLDLAETAQQTSDQRSIQFDRYRDKVVLKITGNYFASYSTSLLSGEDRARETYQDVMLPLLQAAAPALVNASELQAFAFEISHHVRKKVLGVSSEGVENVVLILPKAAAERFVQATSDAARQAAMAGGEVFLNAVPIALWPNTGPHTEMARVTGTETSAKFSPVLTKTAVETAIREQAPAPPSISTSSPRDTSPEALKNIQQLYQTALDRMAQELNPQAHFVRYAPPAFIPFHNGLYLQLSVTTTLPESANGSQYKLAALAFDQHIAHLIRPALSYFKEDQRDFDGIAFSTSIRLTADPSAEAAVAVEFIFPLPLLRAYEHFDCTGQQLIDSSFILINGERVGLTLQTAEAGFQARQ